MAWKILLPQEIMSEGRKLLEDAGHTIIDGRGFEPEDVLADFKEYQPDAMIVRITPISREIIESNPNLKVIVRHGAGFDALDVKACHDNNVQALYAPVANSTSVAETAMLLILEMSRNVTVLQDLGRRLLQGKIKGKKEHHQRQDTGPHRLRKHRKPRCKARPGL